MNITGASASFLAPFQNVSHGFGRIGVGQGRLNLAVGERDDGLQWMPLFALDLACHVWLHQRRCRSFLQRAYRGWWGR